VLAAPPVLDAPPVPELPENVNPVKHAATLVVVTPAVGTTKWTVMIGVPAVRYVPLLLSQQAVLNFEIGIGCPLWNEPLSTHQFDPLTPEIEEICTRSGDPPGLVKLTVTVSGAGMVAGEEPAESWFKSTPSPTTEP
jgi:hypothetical protein